MGEDPSEDQLQALKAEHRRLDEQIAALNAQHSPDQLELARLKRRKLRIKDHMQLVIDQSIPDIIA